MNTITLPTEIYNDIKVYADEKKVSVQDFVVTLIARLYPHKTSTSKKNCATLSSRLRGIAAHAPKDFDYKKELENRY